MRVIDFLTIILTTIQLFSCQSDKVLGASDLKKWIEDDKNGFVQKRTSNGFLFEAQLRPLSYEIANMKLNNQPVESDIKDEMYYFTIKINAEDGSDIAHFNSNGDIGIIQKNLHYLSFGMKNHIELLDDGEKLPCVYYEFERSFDLAKFKTINIGFEPIASNNKTKTLIIGGQYFNTPPVKIKFHESDLVKLPKLKS